MGAWGTGVLENDNALDFLDYLKEESNYSSQIFSNTLSEINDPSYTESPLAAKGLVCIALFLDVVSNYDLEIEDNPFENADFIEDLVLREKARVRAIEAMHEIENNSELAELWQESEYIDEWQKENAEITAILIDL